MRRVRAFTIVAVPLILALSMIALGIALALKAPAGVTAYSKGKMTGAIVGPIVISMFFVWLASRIAERRSHTTATLIIGPILLLMNVAYGVNLMGWAKPVPKGGVTPLASGTAASPSPRTRPSAGPATAAPPPQAPSIPGQAPSQMPSQTPIPAPELAPTPGTAPAPAVSPRLPAVRTPPESTDFAEVAVYAAEGDAKAEAALKALGEELAGEVSAVLTRVVTLGPDAAKAPRHDRKTLAARRDAAGELKDVAARAGKSLSGVVDRAKARLIAAGVDEFKVMGMAIAFSNLTHTHRRAFAADDVARFASDLKAEAELLDTHFAKWKLDASGEVSTQDFSLRSKATPLRMGASSFASRVSDVSDTLEGK